MDKTENYVRVPPSVPSGRQIDTVREEQCRQQQNGHWTPVELLVSQQFSNLLLVEDEWLELILAERDLRRQMGLSPTLAEYTGRFPELANRITALFALASELNSSKSLADDSTDGQTVSATVASNLDSNQFHDASLEKIDLLCDQFEAAYQHGQEPRIEEFLELSGIADERLFRELVKLEIALFQRDGRRLDMEDYRRRFPGRSLPMETLLEDSIPWRYPSKRLPKIGMKIGKYRLEERLGQGGMGTVFRASHSLIDHHVALKLMLPHLVEHPSLQKRFLKEAQVCVGLHHPNLVRTYDIDEDAGCLYLTMELLSGCHLAEQVSKQGPMESQETARIIRQIAEGLAYAHAQGIIHRDVKPQNVMLTNDGQVKLLDLGLAKLLSGLTEEESNNCTQDVDNHWGVRLGHSSHDLVTHDGRLTYAGAILGTLTYMSREQAIHPTIADARNDVFSLGCTAYFLLTGQSVHGSQAPPEILQRLITEDQWPEGLLDAVSSPWKTLLNRMLAWNAKDRFASMAEVIAGIDRSFGTGSPWKPDPDDLEQLREKLLELEIVSQEQWAFAATNRLPYSESTHALSASESRWLEGSTSIPNPALQFLFRMTECHDPGTGLSILTKYQVQQILAGHAGTLRQGEHLIRESLNRGWKGECYLARNVEVGRNETIRLLHLDQLQGLERQSDAATILSQLGTRLQQLSHPSIAKIHSFQLHGRWLKIAGEYLPGDSLRESVKRARINQEQPDGQWIVKTALELAYGVQYLHEQGFLHLDLSPDRWIKNGSGQWCLIGAGLANLLLSKDWKDMPESAGLPPVIAPEMQGDLSRVGKATDIFALGQVFRFLIPGEFPYRSIKLSEITKPALPQAERFESLSYDASCVSACFDGSMLAPSNDWKVHWNDLIKSMTISDPVLRLDSVATVSVRLSEIMKLVHQEVEFASRNAVSFERLSENMKLSHQDTSSGSKVEDKKTGRSGQSRDNQPTFGQRIRRLFNGLRGTKPRAKVD